MCPPCTRDVRQQRLGCRTRKDPRGSPRLKDDTRRRTGVLDSPRSAAWFCDVLVPMQSSENFTLILNYSISGKYSRLIALLAEYLPK